MKLVVKDVEVVLGSVKALDGVTVSVGSGEILGVFGPNGAGKTTLLRTVAGMVKPRRGVITVSGKDIYRVSSRERARLTAYLPPALGGNGFHVTVYDLVSMALYPHGSPDPAAVEEALRAVGLVHLANRTIDSLSSGELQLALVAHALARKAEVVLADEPTAFLDLANRVKVLRLLKTVARRRGVAVILATHDLITAYRFVDKALLLSRGRVVAAGRVAEVLTPDNIKRAYGVEVEVVKASDTIVLVPKG